MPYQDTVGDVVRATSYFTYENGQVEMCSFYYLCQVSGPGDSRLALATHINSAWEIKYQPNLYTGTRIHGTRVVLMPPQIPWTPVVALSGFPGLATTGQLPTQVRPVVTLRTNFVGRAYRGRVYFPTPDASRAVATGGPTSGLVTAMNDTMSVLGTQYTTGGTTWTYVLWHVKKPGQPQQAPSPINSWLVTAKFGTQRRSGEYSAKNTPPF